jgi:ABC-type phosphate transport system auxiliary subunit
MSRFGRLLRRRSHAPSVAAAPELRPLVARIDALEAMVEALQDSVDRQARRTDQRLDELARQLQPSELAQTLSEDARKRGL